MKKGIRWFCMFLVMTATAAVADEEIRQVQEALRKRNLYFGDINGQATADLATALKRYQARKGFPATGDIDELTANSLNVEARNVASSAAPRLPDMPVLRSDLAPQLPDAQRIALQKKAEENPDSLPPPPPPAESPPESQDLSPQRITKFVEDYLRDAETADIAAQARYFTYPVKYFDHGPQDQAFVEKDVQNYVKRWPERKYTLLQPVNFMASVHEGETIVDFPITYTVRRGKYEAVGKTRNTWIVRPEGAELKIVAIQEQRLRE